MRFALTTITASLLALSPARGEVNPDAVFSADPLQVLNGGNLCLGTDCPLPVFGAVQQADCNAAGLGVGVPFMPMDGGSFQQAQGLQLVDPGYPTRGYADPTGRAYLLMPPFDANPVTPGAPGWRPGWDGGFDQGPIRGVFDGGGFAPLPDGVLGDNPASVFGAPAASYASLNLAASTGQLDANLQAHVVSDFSIGATNYVTLLFDSSQLGDIRRAVSASGITGVEQNVCRVVLVPSDPNYLRTGRNGGGSWGQREDDQWAIKRVGYTEDANSAWNALPPRLEPVVVAVIDTGLDWHHRDIDANSLWRNPDELPGNGIDDDGNGYVDDLIGWNFLADDNVPWDYDGHGTVVTGVIAATQNDTGIAGISSNARIMVLKAVNNFGNSRASFLAEAIVYAVDNGASIINISVGGGGVSIMESAAIDYARGSGVLIVAAAGNEGVELGDFGPGGHSALVTVGATHHDDRAAAFSNFGDAIDIVAPGVDVLSLRARYTDANYRPLVDDSYVVGTNFVGSDNRYLRVSGTSFSTPIVTATAALLLGKDPSLKLEQLRYLLLATADDIEQPGKDEYSGHGLLNARAALTTGTDFFVTADITGVEVSEELLLVRGSIDADHFKRAWMQIGMGEEPRAWKYVGQKRKLPIRDGILGRVPLREFAGSELWQIVINVEHRNGVIERAKFPFRIKNQEP